MAGSAENSEKVLDTYFQERGKGVELYVQCRVETFGLIVKKFDEVKVQWVNEMGLDSLLHLSGRTLPRKFYYWLMTKVDHDRKVFVGSSGCEYRLEKKHVNWVLGIPYGPKWVPRVRQGQSMKQFMSESFDKYGVVSKNTKTKYIPMEKIVGVVEGQCFGSDEDEFKVAFLALTLCDVLCPSTSRGLQKSLVPTLTVALEASNYDWCSIVLDKLMESAKRFAINYVKDGYVKGCGGCTFFLLIFYLDHLNKPPVRWGLFPRIRA